MINIQDLTKNYGSTAALQGISFAVNQGEIVGLLGPNGAGKTTAMRIITGFLQPTSGRVTIDSQDTSENLEYIQSIIGYLPESAPLYSDLNVQEHLEFAGQIHGLSGQQLRNSIQSVAGSCGLRDKLFYEITELSKGYKQRVALAQALIHDPKILILDEPTTGLDPNQIIEIRDLITSLSKDKTIILSTHIMQEVEAICNRVILIKEGKIVADGALADVKKNKSTAFQTKVTVIGDAQNILDIIEKIAGVTLVKKMSSPQKDAVVYLIHSDIDIRTSVNKQLINASLDILEITSQENTMEDVFHELTK